MCRGAYGARRYSDSDSRRYGSYERDSHRELPVFLCTPTPAPVAAAVKLVQLSYERGLASNITVAREIKNGSFTVVRIKL